jgi:hypothetical protein
MRTDPGGAPHRPSEGAEGACRFFSVDTVRLRRLSVLVFIHHDTRLVRIAGVILKRVTGWATQRTRNLSMD